MGADDEGQSGLPGKDGVALTRRQILKTFGAGAVAAALGTTLRAQSVSTGARPWVPFMGAKGVGAKEAGAIEAGAIEADAGEVKPARPSPARAFALADVRLLDGPFLQAQQRTAKYLLQLEPDRQLHNFRVNAGLKPKAPVYGGWESMEPWVSIRCHGHTLGHYLSACSLMFAATGDQPFKQRTDYIVSELRECQDAGKNGLVCAFPDGAAPLDAILNATHFVGVPWYTMHKIFAGLRDAYIHTGNRIALEVLVKLSDWAIGHTRNLSFQQFQHMLDTEHGGMNEVLGDVYALTGETRFLALAERFCHRALLEPLAGMRDTLDGLHSNTQIPKVVGFNRLYELTGQENYSAAARFFWRTVVGNRSFVTGGNGDGEHFFPPADFIRHLGSGKTMETCCTHNMLKLTRSLFSLDPSWAYADYYERALYNGILASQDPDSGMMTYFQPTRPGYLKIYCTPIDSFWCCTGTGMENHAKYGDSIYFRGSDALYVNLFIASALTWKEKGLTVTQNTRFPDEDSTRLRLTVQRPLRLTLNIRHPSWCEVATVFVNGRHHTTSRRPGGYVAVNGRWRSGDTVEVHLPMTLRTEPLPGQKDVVAILYGPVVLAGRLGRKGITPGADIIVNERTIGDVLNQKVEVPVLAGEPREIVKHIAPVNGTPLAFQTSGIGRPDDVSLIPYYRVAHERYNLYWKTVR
ncbi:MAG TPA: beta-L-arabinofuranosidase domain-containing protein, partial [Blastocatellia bacterium]|nr:beta-L-arabinofuranosidase domain-containing protein [Blastocatellia bacterium]